MSNDDKIIEGIKFKDAKSRAAMRRNAERAIVKAPENELAHRIIAELDAVEGGLQKPSEFEVTGLLSWEKHRAGQATFRAFHGEKVVGRIFKRADHSMANKDVYSVEILGETLPGSFQHIRDARDAGEQAYAALQKGGA